MQQIYLQEPYYKTRRIDCNTYSPEALERREKLKLYVQLREEGCSEKVALKAIGCSRPTYYRWKKAYLHKGLRGLENRSRTPLKNRKPMWDKRTEQLVLHIRRQFKLWGKLKIATILQREHQISVSPSTVGRILAKLIRLGRIKPARFYYGQTKTKKRRVFKGHSKRWSKQLKREKPGDLVQIDHMSINPAPGKTYKEFKAICPISKIMYAEVYWSASANNAKNFLLKLKHHLPFDIRSIQVDGGSEFRAEFEQACEELGIPLFVLPPRSPELNGHVERCNGTTKYEFYPFYDGSLHIDALRLALTEYCRFYNEYRPHQGLNMLTPMAYYQLQFEEVSKSHMS